MLTRDEYQKIIGEICPHCKRGNTARFRSDSGEWVHDLGSGNRIAHTYCLATNFRKSKVVDEMTVQK